MTIRTCKIPNWTKEFAPKPELHIKKLFSAVALTKMNEYMRQIEVFESKYKMKFPQFKKKVNSAKKENFQEWDDFMLWEGLDYLFKKWQKRYQELK